MNRNPLGACAITTTGFAIDRQMTARLLGFQGLATNSYGAIASVDYIAEACSVLATAMLCLGRFTQDMLLWSTAEFGFLRLSDGYVQISSIMPQKRNPVPLEHVRILASRALHEAQSVLGALHNTPFADSNDGEDSLQPLVSVAFGSAQRACALMAGALSEATFNIDHMRERAYRGFLTVTEAADTLVRVCGLPFHDAHGMVAEAVKSASSDDLSELADALYAEGQRRGLGIDLATLQLALDPENFIALRSVPGGPAPSALNPEIERAEQQSQKDRAWLDDERTLLRAADDALSAACDRILRA